MCWRIWNLARQKKQVQFLHILIFDYFFCLNFGGVVDGDDDDEIVMCWIWLA